jgi:hypothetical protein
MTSQKENKYDPVEDLDLDLENDSETTLASPRFLKAPPKRLSTKPRSTSIQTVLTWSRWSFIVILQTIMIFLLLGSSSGGKKKWTEDMTETGGDVNGLYIPSKLLPPLFHIAIDGLG